MMSNTSSVLSLPTSDSLSLNLPLPTPMTNERAIQVLAEQLRKTPMSLSEATAAEDAMNQLNALVQADAEAKKNAEEAKAREEENRKAGIQAKE